MSRNSWDPSGHGFAGVLKHLQTHHDQTGTIRRACAAVEDCIVTNKDNLRGFFQHCFPVLLTRLFGFDDFEPSWFTLVAKGREEDARALIRLLSPDGKLFGAMHSADADRLIQFMFPKERLPAHTQELLGSASGLAELQKWPQYRGHVSLDATGKPQVTLNMFEYFLFWTAFYVLRGGQAADSSRSVSDQGRHRPGQQLYAGIKSYSTHLVAPKKDSPGAGQPYFTLLRTYLGAYLPRPGSNEGGRRGAGAGTSSAMLGRLGGVAAYSMGGVGEPTPGETILSILMEFWLTDVGEPLPPDPATTTTTGSSVTSPRDLLSAAVTGAPGAMAPALTHGAATAAAAAAANKAPMQYSYQPPADELVAAATVLVRYIYRCEPSSPDRPPTPAQGPVAWLPLSPVQTHPLPMGRLGLLPRSTLLANAAGLAAEQAVTRKLYRMLRRALSQWQQTSNSANLTPLLKLWLTILAPWRNISGVEDDRGGNGGGGGGPHLPHAAAATMTTINRWGSGIVQHLPRTSSHADGGGDERAKGMYGPEWRPHVLTHLPFYLILLPQLVDLTASRMSHKPDTALKDLFRMLRDLFKDAALISELRAAERAYNRYMSSSPRRQEGELAELLPWLANQAADFEAAAAAGPPTQPPIKPSPTFKLFSTERGGAAWCARNVLRAVEAGQGVSSTLRRNVDDAVRRMLPLDALPDEEAAAVEEELAYEGSELQFPRAGRWQELKYHGDPMLRPITSYEVPVLVRTLVALSRALNRLLGLDCYSPPADEPPETIVQEWLQLLRRRRFRFNLRPLAEIQTLVWLVVLGLIVYGLMALLVTEDGDGDDGQVAAPDMGRQHQHNWHEQQGQQQPQQPWNVVGVRGV